LLAQKAQAAWLSKHGLWVVVDVEIGTNEHRLHDFLQYVKTDSPLINAFGMQRLIPAKY
jgi:hypothetical protein